MNSEQLRYECVRVCRRRSYSFDKYRIGKKHMSRVFDIYGIAIFSFLCSLQIIDKFHENLYINAEFILSFTSSPGLIWDCNLKSGYKFYEIQICPYQNIQPGKTSRISS